MYSVGSPSYYDLAAPPLNLAHGLGSNPMGPGVSAANLEPQSADARYFMLPMQVRSRKFRNYHPDLRGFGMSEEHFRRIEDSFQQTYHEICAGEKGATKDVAVTRDMVTCCIFDRKQARGEAWARARDGMCARLNDSYLSRGLSFKRDERDPACIVLQWVPQASCVGRQNADSMAPAPSSHDHVYAFLSSRRLRGGPGVSPALLDVRQASGALPLLYEITSGNTPPLKFDHAVRAHGMDETHFRCIETWLRDEINRPARYGTEKLGEIWFIAAAFTLALLPGAYFAKERSRKRRNMVEMCEALNRAYGPYGLHFNYTEEARNDLEMFDPSAAPGDGEHVFRRVTWTFNAKHA